MARVTKKTKKVSKRWVEIVAPQLFRQQTIGETFVVDPKNAIGRDVTVNLMNLTGDPKRQNINIMFTISALAGDKLASKVKGYYLIPSSIKRVVRRGSTRIDESNLFKTADDLVIRMKTLLLTKSRVSRSAATAIRHMMKEEIASYLHTHSYEDLITEIIQYKFQNGMKKKINKIYPVKRCEVRYVTTSDKRRDIGREVKPKKEPVKEDTKNAKTQDKQE